MRCCIECFKDQDIRARIRRTNEQGHCDISVRHTKETWTIDLDRVDRTSDYGEGIVPDFEEIADLYTTVSENHPRGRKLAEHLKDEWGIFSLDFSEIIKLLNAVLSDYFVKNPKIKNGFVAPEIEPGSIFYANKSILSGQTWADFENTIRFNNRFHNGIFKPDILKYFFERMISEIPVGNLYYRARIISENEVPIKDAEIGPAPQERATSGRLNAAGISYLYLGNDQMTVTVEIKAAIQDLVAMGQFEVIKPLNVVDLEMLGNLGPFQIPDKSSYLINRPILLAIDNALRRQSGRQRSEVEYAPTEYISDLIKTMIGNDDEPVDGIFYDSTVRPGSQDLVLFGTEKVELKGSIEYLRITGINPNWQPLSVAGFKIEVQRLKKRR